MILVAGATGQLGGLITSSLLERQESVRVLVRDAASQERFTRSGAEAVLGDLKDADSLARACDGVAEVVTTANATARAGDDSIESVDMVGNRSLIDQARARGVQRFVFVSALGADPAAQMPLLRAKGETERCLRESGMRWTVLRPNVFMDKLLIAVVAAPVLGGRPVRLVGEGLRRHSLVAMRDVAAYVTAALRDDTAVDQTLTIGGPEPVSWRDAVSIFAAELGHPIEIRTSPLGEPVPGLPDFITSLLSALETYDSPLPMGELAARFRIRPTSLPEFVHEIIGSWATARQPHPSVG
jgi:uncharacterized protein YbjT (DUF2867 family)